MKDKLVIQNDDYCFRIYWYIAEGDDYGMILGDDRCEYPIAEAAVVDALPEEWETRLAEYVIGQLEPKVNRDDHGYYWDTAADARAALRLINLAIKQGKGKPWPPWALAAKAAGWV